MIVELLDPIAFSTWSDDHGAAQRLETEIFSSPLFENLRASDPSEFTRQVERVVRFVPGDTTKPRLGLSPEHQLELSDEVDFVVNCAASTDFRESLESALKTNTYSVGWILDFVQNSAKAKLLHISTCYVGERQTDIVLEGASGPSPRASLPLPWFSSDTLNLTETFRAFHAHNKQNPSIDRDCELAQSLGWNNVYTLTKWLGERLLVQSKDPIHATILRPSIIESCAQDPIPGWIEGFKVADPLFYMGGRDQVRYFPGDNRTIIDIIPADRVANAMFLCLAELSAQHLPELKFYQVCSSTESPVTLGEITRFVRSAFGLGHLKRSFFVKGNLFFPLAEAGFFKLKCLAKVLPARFKSTVENFGKLMEWARLYVPYTSVTNLFSNKKMLELASRAPVQDQNLFPVGMKSFDWRSYLADIHLPGLMRFVLHKPIIQKSFEPTRRAANSPVEQLSAS